MIKEYEIKSEIGSKRKKLLLSSYSSGKEITQVDKYFDTADCALFTKGVFVRIRDDSSLDVKFNPNLLDSSHLVCDEYSYKNTLHREDVESILGFFSGLGVDLAHPTSTKSFEEVLHSMGLVKFVIIRKNRMRINLSDNIDAVLDRVDGVGEYIELEVNTEEYLNELNSWINRLDLKNIPVGYVELWLRKHDVRKYKMGRYLLPEDR